MFAIFYPIVWYNSHDHFSIFLRIVERVDIA